MKVPVLLNVQLPIAPAGRTSGLGEHVTPVVVLNLTWWATVSLFVNLTTSFGTIAVDFGTRPFFVIVTATVFAAAVPITTSAVARASRINFRIEFPLNR